MNQCLTPIQLLLHSTSLGAAMEALLRASRSVTYTCRTFHGAQRAHCHASENITFGCGPLFPFRLSFVETLLCQREDACLTHPPCTRIICISMVCFKSLSNHCRLPQLEACDNCFSMWWPYKQDHNIDVDTYLGRRHMLATLRAYTSYQTP